MKTILPVLLKLGGVAHFCILIASALVPRSLDWKGQLAKLPLILRQMFWVYGGFIVLTIIAFGTLTLCFTQELADGGSLARGFCAFVSVFWLVRLGVQFILDAKPYLTNGWLRLGYHFLPFVFAFLVVVYGIGAILAR